MPHVNVACGMSQDFKINTKLFLSFQSLVDPVDLSRVDP